ncbi:hypothetical protein [Nonomuraea sp. NPDC049709]|uniref:hypothetical protein n=1 Tax=Nonomuraea sp. NPDC049709 TaxID=3154736 RepID=UPI00342C1F74
MTPEQYAQAVREALAGHPEREELLEDLDDHLAEIAADSGLPLEDRLGPPEAYAEELAAAYGERPERGPRKRLDPHAWARRVHNGLMGQGPYRSFVGFLPELRPGWWVLRGYVLAMLLLSMTGEGQVAPENPADWAVVAAGVWVSVWFGRRRRRRPVVLAAVAANVVASLALLAGLAQAESPQPREVYMAQPDVWMRQASSDGVYNIQPYAKDGTPLTDVYLYDQDGNPLTTDPEDYGYEVDRSCGEPVLNRYPLPLVERRAALAAETGPSPTPSACPTPQAAPVPAATATPAPVPTPAKTPEKD